jgi:hypothetical protein
VVLDGVPQTGVLQMRFLYILLTSLVLIGLSACEKKVSFALSPAATVMLYNLETGDDRQIQPNTDNYNKLHSWIAKNQDGWQAYLATRPYKGLIVRANQFSLQFIGKSVLLVDVHQGVLTKPINPSEYVFLLGESPATATKSNH